MKIFLRIILVIVAIVAVLAIVGFFIPSKVRVVRSATIKASPEIIYGQISALKNWPAWSPWHRLDPQMEITYFGPESGMGQGYVWKSKHSRVGNGKMTITVAKPNEALRTVMEFEGMGSDTAEFNLKTVDGGTEVSWVMDGDMGKNPFSHYLGLMMDKMVGPDFEKGLHNLDSVSTHIAAQAPPTPSENKPESN